MKRSGFAVMARLIGLVGPLTGYMLLAIFLGLAGHLCAAFLTVLGGYAALEALGLGSLPLGALFAGLLLCGLVRGFLRYGEQAATTSSPSSCWPCCGERCSGPCGGCAPPSWEGKDRGDLISLITSDIELLEVFYATPSRPSPSRCCSR